MANEKELGKILAGVDHLNTRFGEQELRIGAIESNISKLYTSAARQPAKCMEKIEDKFATKESIKPLEEMSNTLKKTALMIFIFMITSIIAVIAYVRGGV